MSAPVHSTAVFGEPNEETRHDALPPLSFSKPLTPWQATYELAAHSAIEADRPHRKLGSEHVYLSAGIEIENDAGNVPLTLDLEPCAEALEVVRRYRTRALAIADDRIADLAADAAGQARWRMIRSRIVQILEAGSKDAR